ncbi:Chromosome (plasmid) partitioning protein ParB [invertebrate metagenome]|uniref:Chromosome (Plasmid) partitioning protein ParB n=1 Tax=invertebrate metagenome TaxID=1711999 RepID=A0A484HCT8_9ZZZZ
MHKDRFQRLGRGLASLLGDDETSFFQEAAHSAPVDSLHSGRFQARRRFDAVGITHLVDSIRQRGILQPILVRPFVAQPGHYEIIAGERRWQAARQAHLHEVPIVVHDLSDREALEVSLVENLQRQDLSPLEEAEGYSRLIEEFHHTHEELAQAIGKSRSHVANMMRLLALPDPVKSMLNRDTLSVGHARALLGACQPVQLAQSSIGGRGLNICQTEKRVQNEGRGTAHLAHCQDSQDTVSRETEDAKDTDRIALEQAMSSHLKLKVCITFHKKGGHLTIHYDTLEQLDDILLRLHAESPPSPS